MGTYQQIEIPLGQGRRIGLLGARFNGHITKALYDGALEALRDAGVEQIFQHSVPGAFELPGAAMAMALAGSVDAIVCVGAVIRGETAHFDYVAGQCAAGIMEVTTKTGVPVGFGVITTENEQQALDRAGGVHGNKGHEAAVCALEMITTFEAIRKGA